MLERVLIAGKPVWSYAEVKIAGVAVRISAQTLDELSIVLDVVRSHLEGPIGVISTPDHLFLDKPSPFFDGAGLVLTTRLPSGAVWDEARSCYRMPASDDILSVAVTS
jgi:hypothetical protein